MRQTRVIEAQPWGVTDQPRFLNQVLEIEWSGSPRRLLATAKAVEREGGRKPARRWGPRAIDIDILLFDRVSVSEPDLQIPHPRISERPFVVAGLSELGVKSGLRSGAR